MNINRRELLKSVFMTASCLAVTGVAYSEYDKCKNDIVYFVNRYMLDGNNSLTPWQEQFMYHLAEGKNSAVLNAHRQSGKTMMAVCYHVWRKVFFDNNVAIVTMNNHVNDYVQRFIKKRINNVPSEFIGSKNIDFSYLDGIIVSESTFINHNIKDKKCNSIILDEFAFFKDIGKCAHTIIDFIEHRKVEDVQMVFASTPYNNSFDVLCDMVSKERRGNYFKADTCGAMRT